MNNPKFEIRKTTQFRFNLKAPNGEIILTSETYSTNQSCSDGIATVKRNAPLDERYERKDADGNYRFNLRAANGLVIGRSESYATLYSRDRGIEAVKRNAPIANILDLS
ncbi:YegP family protein [uncultured Chitinophaga sp.]|uniref:YegP family protein n=1 Tax=uncultured Chitinophaga sp. TaxID=339340 RepID=UPI0025E64681|nr:YegP family protein [uncultured Chitinophaga sp.]